MRQNLKYQLASFENINGEGVVANIKHKESQTKTKVICGNDKLLDRFKVDLDFNNFRMNMQSLEREGKTVVCMAIDQVPRLLISLELTLDIELYLA